MNELAQLHGILVAWIVSDDVFGDITGRRLANAELIANLAEVEEPCRRLQKLWILNRFRDHQLASRYRRMLGCRDACERELGGERVLQHSATRANTRVVEIPFRQAALDACADRRAALRYLANPNVGRNAAIAFGAADGARSTFVLDGDIYLPGPTLEQTARLFAAHGAEHPVWLFTLRAWSLEQFAAALPRARSGQTLLDACGNLFVFNSWPPAVIELGDEGMLGLPAGSGDFDELREYSNNPKVAYCAALRAGGRRLLTPSYPVCHLEHRENPILGENLSVDEREVALLKHRLAVRSRAKKEMLERWRPGGRHLRDA